DVPDLVQEDLAWDDDDPDAAPLECVTDRDFKDTRKLFRNADELGVDTALAEELLGVRLLKVASADLVARYVRSDREHWNAAAVRVEEPVDEMKIARPAA